MDVKENMRKHSPSTTSIHLSSTLGNPLCFLGLIFISLKKIQLMENKKSTNQTHPTLGLAIAEAAAIGRSCM